MSLNRLTQPGVTAMNDWLDSVQNEPVEAPPATLINLGQFVEPTGYGRIAEPIEFRSRFEWGQYAMKLFGDTPDAQIQADGGMWAWLTLIYFDQVCPPVGGIRRIRQRARYIPTGTDFRTYYRHLLAGPWQILAAHRDDPVRTQALLGGEISKPGDLYEQMASRMELATSATVLSLLNALYLDSTTGHRKRGAGGAGRGSPRRLADVLMQLDMTFDIYAMPLERLLKLLPKEFDRFRTDNL